MKSKFLGVALVGIATLVGSSAIADSLKFKIVNESKYIISSFQSNEGDGWSKNWLSADLDGGESVGMQFLRDGPCDVQVRVGWRTTDGGQEKGDPWNINICDAHSIYFDGHKVTYE